MEAVTADALVIIGARQREGVGDEGMGAMEGGVEAGDLRYRRERLHRRLDSGDVMRLVQGRERDELAELGQHRGVDHRRLGQVQPAMDDPMPDCDDPARKADAFQPCENGAGGDLMVDAAGGRVEFEFGLFARRSMGRAFRRRPDPLDLSCGDAPDVAIVDAEGGELQRGRAGVESENNLAQSIVSAVAWVTQRPWRPAARRRRTPGLRGDSTGKAGPAHMRRDAPGRCRPGLSA